MSCECTPIKTRNYYRYYDTPDGCDIFKKMLVTSKYGAIAGLIISTYDVLMYSHAVGFRPMMRRDWWFNCYENKQHGVRCYGNIASYAMLFAKFGIFFMLWYAYHTIPFTLAGATFAVVANNVQNYRNKNDSLNYFLGGLACAPILVYYFGTYHAMMGGIILGIAGKVKKDSIDSGRVLFPKVSGHMGSVNSWRNDYTFIPDPKDTYHHTCSKK